MDDNRIRISADALIAMAVTEAETRELATMPSLEKLNADFHPSAHFQKRIRDTIEKIKRKERREKNWQILKRTFVAITACCSIFFCLLLPANAVQVSILTTLIEWKDTFVSILFSGEEGITSSLSKSIEFHYIPEGFLQESEEYIGDTQYEATFQNQKGQYLKVSIVSVSTHQDISLDNEQAKAYQINFNGQNALWESHNDGSDELVWEDNYVVFRVYGDVDLGELINIADNIIL